MRVTLALSAGIWLLFTMDLVALQEDGELLRLTETFWAWKLGQFPEYATREGFHLYDDRLESFTLQTFEYRKNNCSQFLGLANAINTSRLSWSDDLTLKVIKDQLHTYINGYNWRLYGNLSPVNFLEGIHRDIRYWVTAFRFTEKIDYTKYIERLERLPTQIQEIIILMQKAIEIKRTSHRVSVEEVPGQIEDLFLNMEPQQTIFFKPFKNSTLNNVQMSQKVRHAIRRQGKDVIRTQLQPAFRNLTTFLKQQYMPHTRQSYGVHSLTNGLEYYKTLLHWHLSIHIEPQEVHNLGLSEVARIEKQMNKIMNQINFTEGLSAFFEHMRTQKHFYNHTEDELLDGYKHIVHTRIGPKLASIFTNLTDIPQIKIQKMPYDGIDAQYSDGTLLANTKQPNTRPKFTMMALALHEANPGHHLQVSLTKILPIPKFRRYLWGGKKFSAPFHFPYYTAYVEGWGLYAEYLGEEMGLYHGPYELFGRYTFEMFRACRLVVDTGIHALGWSRQKAIDYMLNYTFITSKQATTEIDRYITWPGQACAYKVGEIRIKQLRQRAQDILGEKFDIQAFHWQVIRLGFVPLEMMEEAVEEWIQEKLSSAATSRMALGYHGLALLPIVLLVSIVF